jgi:hypothetical protein
VAKLYLPTLHWDMDLPSDDAIVVRGGHMRSADLHTNATSVNRLTNLVGSPVWGICVGVADGMSAQEIAVAMPYRGDWFRQARMGDLVSVGFNFVLIDEPPHAVLLLKEEPTGDDWSGWDDVRVWFDPAELKT